MDRKKDGASAEAAHSVIRDITSSPRGASSSFAGRIGGNQSFTVDRNDDANTAVLAHEPDAAPGMSLEQQFNLRPFRSLGLWKAAVIEGFGGLVSNICLHGGEADDLISFVQAPFSSSF